MRMSPASSGHSSLGFQLLLGLGLFPLLILLRVTAAAAAAIGVRRRIQAGVDCHLHIAIQAERRIVDS